MKLSMDIPILVVLLFGISLAEDSPCEFHVNDEICYWSEVHRTWDTTYPQAVEICENKGSQLAVVRDEETYEAILNNLRAKIPSYWDTLYAWIGNQIDPKTGIVYPHDSYIKWFPKTEPRLNSDDYDNFYLHVYVDKDPESPFQGMGNLYKEFIWPAVVCEYVSE